MATEIWVNSGSGNGLLPDGTKPLPEPMLTYHQLGRVAFTWWQYSLEMLTMSLAKRGLKITHLKSQPHLPRGKELTHTYPMLFQMFWLADQCRPQCSAQWHASHRHGVHGVGSWRPQLHHLWPLGPHTAQLHDPQHGDAQRLVKYTIKCLI